MRLIIFNLLFLICSCNISGSRKPGAGEIIQKSIAAHGGDHFNSFDISFDFRQYRVKLKNDQGNFLYIRSYTDSLNNSWRQELTNGDFAVFKNDSLIKLANTIESQQKEGLNAIAYFALLPLKLSDPAVIPSYLGTIEIEDQTYFKIAVTFTEDKGGKDHEDEFCYWINAETYQLNYLAYSNGGPRFRKVTDRTKVGGIVFQDYQNFSMTDTVLPTHQYDSAFIQGLFHPLSVIEQNNYIDNFSTQ